jgi:MftR C-terminal domain
VIASNPELQERELTKLAALATAIAGALRSRGVDDPTAALTAEVTIAVFRTAFERWIDETNRHDFPELVRESLDRLKALTAA